MDGAILGAKVAEGSKASPEGADDGASVRGLREGCRGALLAETLIGGSEILKEDGAIMEDVTVVGAADG